MRHIGRDGAKALDLEVSAIMTRNVRTARENDSESELMALMTEHRIRHLPVVHEGKLSGMVSIGDVLAQEVVAQQTTIDYLHAYLRGRM